MRSLKSLRICEKGHRYYKSSDCPTCPVCAQEEKPTEGFMAGLSAPAQRALAGAGINTLQQLAKKSEAHVLALHGMGPASIPKLRKVLADAGLTFAAKESQPIKKVHR
ncbi:RNA polymerase alpha subunit C-terminal domain-containing protein [Fulvivirgaceae bacterium PWU5]|uniref:RNA polymerase alpha subunit C-terminal domain-containing protein n=1 Tax=Dawidia cretensis TaxID=2782350 RepID=A0AAP2DW94_9BACT|nr:RNA polymerase alpha subunit C-terminal domain-containing protein [Dawidia cretensis]MBT1707177.1 RNA polymerase alpha subunit C-terminal domain-containing protein [Dawidia cretensis]